MCSSVHGILQARTLGCHYLLQGIFPTQGLNPGLLLCRQIVYCLSHKGSPYYYIITYKAMFILMWPVHSYSQQCLLISRILNFDEIHCINISFCVECFLDPKEFSRDYPKCGEIFLYVSFFLAVVQSFSHVWLFVTPWTATWRLPCPSPSPRACSNSCPLSWWWIQPSHSLLSLSTPSFSLSEHKGLF